MTECAACCLVFEGEEHECKPIPQALGVLLAEANRAEMNRLRGLVAQVERRKGMTLFELALDGVQVTGKPAIALCGLACCFLKWAPGKGRDWWLLSTGAVERHVGIDKVIAAFAPKDSA